MGIRQLYITGVRGQWGGCHGSGHTLSMTEGYTDKYSRNETSVYDGYRLGTREVQVRHLLIIGLVRARYNIGIG